MALYGFCRIMVGVALSVEVRFYSLYRLASCRVLSAAPASAIFVKARKWFVLAVYAFALLKKRFSLPRSRVYARARFNDNNNNIIDIDNRYRYKVVLACFSLFQVVLACSCFIALYQYVTTDFAKQLYKALLIAFSANSEKSPFIGFKWRQN